MNIEKRSKFIDHSCIIGCILFRKNRLLVIFYNEWNGRQLYESFSRTIASKKIRSNSCAFARLARHQQNSDPSNLAQREFSVNQTEREEGKVRYVSREKTVGDRGGRVSDETT